MSDKYELDLTASDIGEIIEIIRIQHLKMNDESFAHKIGVPVSTLVTVENGKGPHGVTTLKKVAKAFPTVKIGLTVEIK